MRLTRYPTWFAIVACIATVLMAEAKAQDNVPHADPEFEGKIGETFK
jgi:hypothetical protein